MSKVAALFDMHAPSSGGDDDVVDDPNDDDADDRPIDIGTASHRHLPQLLPCRVKASVVVAGSYQ